MAAGLLGEAAFEEFFLGGVDGGGGAKGVAVAVGVVETGCGFAGKGGQKGLATPVRPTIPRRYRFSISLPSTPALMTCLEKCFSTEQDRP